MNKKTYIQVFWTCGSIDEARKIASSLVQNRMVACANIITAVESIFLWEGEIKREREVKVIFKTRDEKFEEVKNYILNHASYTVPEILKVNIAGGNQDYLGWIDDNTTSNGS